MANRPEAHRLLSVQSHVAAGYVGNRAATFPLQLLGWDVDVVNTVQFSNHTGYGRWGGARFDADHLESVFDGLDRNGLLRYSRLLTGYVPNAASLRAISSLVDKLRSYNPDLIYALDPVMGDKDKGLYVSADVVPVYKELLSKASIITPNQFEVEILVDQEITSLSSLYSVLCILHTKFGVPHVIISSVSLPDSDLASLDVNHTLPQTNGAAGGVGSSQHTTMTLIGSSFVSGKDDQLRPFAIAFPEIKGYFSGVGDLFSAMVAARFQPDKDAAKTHAVNENGARCTTPLARASEQAIATLQGVLRRTNIESSHTFSQRPASSKEDPKEEKVRRMRSRELRIVQSLEDIVRPEIVYEARTVSGPVGI